MADALQQLVTNGVDRNELRSRLLMSRPLKTKVITFFGEQLELRQRTLGEVFEVDAPEDSKHATVQALIVSAFIPGTNTHVFESGDADALLAMPWGQDYQDVISALAEISGINFPKPSDS